MILAMFKKLAIILRGHNEKRCKITINATLFLIALEVFFHAGKTLYRRFRGVFREGIDFFDPQIILSAAKGGLENSKKPAKFPNIDKNRYVW